MEEKTKDVERVQDEDKHIIKKTHFHNWVDALDEGPFDVFMKNIQGIMKTKTDDFRNTKTTKCNMEKQDYFPSSKCQKVPRYRFLCIIIYF